MGTESVHVEVTRFDLVLSGASRERVSEGFEKTTRCLGPRGDGAGIPKDFPRKETGKTYRPKKRSVDAYRYPERNRKERVVLPKSMGCSRTEGPLTY